MYGICTTDIYQKINSNEGKSANLVVIFVDPMGMTGGFFASLGYTLPVATGVEPKNLHL